MSEKPTYEELERRIQELEIAEFALKTAEKELRESEEKYKTIIENIEDGYYEVDIAGNFTFFNESMCEILGYSRNELAGVNNRQYMDVENAKKVFNAFNRVYATGQPYKAFDWELIRKDGSRRYVEASVALKRDSKDQPIGFQGIARDITERKRAEEALVRRRAEFEAIFHSISDSTVYTDTLRRIVMVNQAFTTTFGYKLEEVKGRTTEFLYATKEDYEEIGRNRYRIGIEPDRKPFEAKYRHKDGTLFRAESRGDQVKDARGDIIGFFAIHRDITERKRMEEAFREREEKYRNLFNNAEVGIFRSRLDGSETLEINRKFLDIVGMTREEVIGKPSVNLWADPKEREEMVKRLVADGSVSGFEYRMLNKRLCDVRNCLTSLRLYRETGILEGSILDITERKNTEEAIRESQNRYRTLIEAIPDPLVVYDPEGRVTYVNDAFDQVYGWSREELLGNLIDFVPPTEVEATQEAWRRTLQDGTVFFETKRFKKNGDLLDIQLRTAILRDHEGRHALSIVIHRDITENKRVEESLRESEGKHRTVLEANPDPIVVYDMEGKVIYMNPAFERVFRWSLEECMAKRMDHFVPDECWLETKMMIDKVKGGEIFSGIETLRFTKDGEMIPVNISASFYRNQDGNIDASVINLRDISQQKRLEAQLQQAHKMEAVGTLAGGIAHEFNNILGIIIGNTELAIDDVPDWNPAKACLEEIRTASLRAKDVVRQILSFSRKIPSSKKPINISTIVRESLRLMRATIPTGIEIRQEILCESEMILANPTEINQILLNLCNNSAHSMEEETGILEIRLETATLNDQSATQYKDLTAGEYVKLTVKDTGSGIDPKIMDRIFDPYFTTKGADKGLGMGLAVVYGIVKKHDGAIKIMSEAGKGTTAEVLFPVSEAQAEITEEESEALPRGAECVLLVDDEKSLVKMVSQMLERHGYKVVGTTSSTEALKLFQEEPDKFDLVITDVAMPEMTGDRLAQELIKIRPTIPIILCTGHSTRIDEERAKTLGIFAYAMKPLVKKDLVKAVRKVLNEAKG